VRLIVLVGLPGSGKSTWAANQRLTALSSDHLRELLLDDATAQSANAEVFRHLRALVRSRLRLARPATVVDATNLTRAERRVWIRIAREFGAEAEAVWFDVPLDECKRRNRARSRVVPDEAMERLARKLTPPELSEGFARVQAVRERTRSTAAAERARPARSR
jgi:predicted kinase